MPDWDPARLHFPSSLPTKAELVGALKEAFAYCDKAHAAMTDASGAEMVKSMGGERPKLGVLGINQVHSIEHYGNLVTYMRLKGIVPPSSEPPFGVYKPAQ